MALGYGEKKKKKEKKKPTIVPQLALEERGTQIQLTFTTRNLAFSNQNFSDDLKIVANK